MTQFIQYLYEYQNGERVRNLGFMKVEQQMDKMVIQIYAKQMDEVKGIYFQKSDGSKYLATWEVDEEERLEQPRQRMPMQEEMIQTDVIQEEAEEVTSYIPPSTRRCEKIQRHELSRLPKKEWKIANNSFLLHGFYNYHHLLYIEDGDEVWIGVPGIYHKKEEEAANAFGFTSFQRLTDLEVEISEEEKYTSEDFGYWCRQIEMHKV